ncbi:hypothetical protein ABEY41_03955 [Peribacillus butanolivorans]|uniref:hypothetical protein n=1 Tax=Peribacillus butanolivorans TaxID=421767 RepID=UPI003D2BF5D2
MQKLKLCFIVSAASILFISFPVAGKPLATSIASQGYSLEKNDTTESEGKVVFRYKNDFKSLAKFLNITEKEYFKLRNEKSMLEIAQQKGISEDELFRYLIDKHYKALESAYNKKEIDVHFIMDYVLRLKEDLYSEMNAKSIKDLK